MKKKITIIGCGWLGKILLPHLNDFDVFKTTRQNFDIEHFKLLPPEISHSDIIIYSIPPLTLPLIEKFFQQLSADKKIIFISSTSVYGKSEGAVDEEHKMDVCKGNPVLIATETYLRENFKNVTIIRPGGLYGYNRHPLRFLSGKKGLKSGDEYTHLVHGEDVARAILRLIGQDLWGQTFNLVSDLRMQKKDFYTALALKFGFDLPMYDHVENKNPTIISNTKAKRIMGLVFHDPFVSLD